jgi:hypothetical protein
MKKKFEITKFEVLETSSEMLKGGFSTAYAGGTKAINISGNNVGNCPTVNNCNGGNCVKGCGASDSSTITT